MRRSLDRTSTSLRIRLIAIILILVGPLAAFQALELWQVKAGRTRLTQQQAFDLAKAAAARYQDTVDDIRSVLSLLSRVRDVTDAPPEACARFLSGIAPSHSWARTFFLADRSGRVTCSTNPAAIGFDLSVREWFQKAKASGPFSVSDFVVSQVSGMPSSFAIFSFRNETTGEEQTVATGLNLAWFDRLAEATNQRPDALMMLVDHGGIVLSRHPRAIIPGYTRIASKLMRDINLQHESLFAGIDPDGQERLFGAFGLSGTQARIVVGFDRSAALGQIDKYIVIAALVFGGVMFFGAIAVWFIGDRIFVQPMQELGGFLRATLDSMDQGLIAIDRNGRASIMNTRVVGLLGLPEEFVKSHPHQNEILAHQRRNGEFASDEQFESIRAGIERREHGIYERQRPDGTVLEIRTVPTADGGLVRTYTDMTHKRIAEEELRRAKERAEAAAAAKSEFLANMSHELRTPLTAIIGVSDLLLKEPDMPERQRRFIEMQHSAGRGLLSVISDVLDFSKIEAGQLELDVQPFELEPLLNSCMEIVESAARRKNLDLTLEMRAGLPRWVSGDALRLRQIVLNLMSNAVKFTDAGSVKLSVEAPEWPAGALRICVTDSGVGIEPDRIGAIFERFSQADSSTTRRFGGSGLGLAISQKLAALMGGQIVAESVPGSGSIFAVTVVLPACAEPDDTSEDMTVRGAAYRILLAEDNDLNRQIIKAMLEQRGHAVTAVAGGAEAIRAAAGFAFDAILMDVQMPDMSGYQATQAIRSGAQTVLPPIVALTANVLSGEAERCVQAGMSAYLAKPVNWPVLFETLDRLIGQHRAARGNCGDAGVPVREGPAPLAVLNRATLGQISLALGIESTTNLIRLFAVEVRQFQQLCSPGVGRLAIERDAHSFGGSAALLGFDRLAEACRGLSVDGETAFDELTARCQQECAAALDEIALRLGGAGFAQAPAVAAGGT